MATSFSAAPIVSERLGHVLAATVSLPILLAALAACGVSSPTPAPECLRTNVPSADTSVYASDSVDLKARPEQGFKPPFSDILVTQTHTPNVEADAIVETTGQVSERSIVLRHIDNGEHASAVIEIVKNTRYCPAIRHGLPVRSRILVKFYIVARGVR